MKNSIFALTLIAAVALGCLYLRESHKTSEAEIKIEKLEQRLAEIETRAAEQETRANSLQNRLRDTRDKVVAKAEEVTQLQQVITNQTEADAKAQPLSAAMKGMGEMLKNPQMKEFVKNQQKSVLGGMLEKSYAPLFAQLGLSPEQSASLKELVVNKSLVGADVGFSLMSGDTDPDNRSQMIQQVKADREAIDEQIKQLLGEDNFKQFQGYEKSMPDRMMIGMFRDQQGAGITPEQEGQLVQLMGEERQNFKFTTDFSDQNKLTEDFAGNFTDEKVAQFLKEQEQLHQKYLSRAQTVLSADQASAFEKYLAMQRQMQGMGLKMASQMFGTKK